jgi:hypothetical protein
LNPSLYVLEMRVLSSDPPIDDKGLELPVERF